jgi:hypothetical protein
MGKLESMERTFAIILAAIFMNLVQDPSSANRCEHALV